MAVFDQHKEKKRYTKQGTPLSLQIARGPPCSIPLYSFARYEVYRNDEDNGNQRQRPINEQDAPGFVTVQSQDFRDRGKSLTAQKKLITRAPGIKDDIMRTLH